MPAAIVRRKVEVIKLLGKVFLAQTPVNAEIFGQKRSNHHAQSVVHPAAMIQLAHRGIDQRVTGAPLAPGLVAFRPVGPLNRVVVRFERLAEADLREAVEDHEVEVTPDQFAEPDRRFVFPGKANQFADRDRAKAQMNRKVGNAFDRREVPQIAVAQNSPIIEFFPQRTRARHAGLDANFPQVARFKTYFCQRRYASQLDTRQIALALVGSGICYGQPL